MDQLLQYPSCLQLLEQVEYVAEAFIVLLPHQTLQVQHTSSYLIYEMEVLDKPTLIGNHLTGICEILASLIQFLKVSIPDQIQH